MNYQREQNKTPLPGPFILGCQMVAGSGCQFTSSLRVQGRHPDWKVLWLAFAARFFERFFESITRWRFQIFFMFTFAWEDDPIWLVFANGLVQPLTRISSGLCILRYDLINSAVESHHFKLPERFKRFSLICFPSNILCSHIITASINYRNGKDWGMFCRFMGLTKMGTFPMLSRFCPPPKNLPKSCWGASPVARRKSYRRKRRRRNWPPQAGPKKGCVCVFFVFFTSPISFTSEVTQRTRTGVPLTFNSVPAVFTVFSRDSKGFGRFTRWWFQIFFIFTTTWGRFPIWLIFFRWVETTNQIHV